MDLIKLDHNKLLGFKLEQVASAAAKIGFKPLRGAKVGTKFGVKSVAFGAKIGGKPEQRFGAKIGDKGGV